MSKLLLICNPYLEAAQYVNYFIQLKASYSKGKKKLH